MSVITKTQLENASLDANSWQLFINGDNTVTVVTRTGATYPSISKFLVDLVNNVSFAEATYPSVSQGIANTTNGQYFRVPQGEDSDLAFIYYLNNNGTAEVVATLASGAIASLIGKSDNLNLQVTYDSQLIVSQVVDDKGAIFTPDNIESLNKKIKPLSENKSPHILNIVGANKAVYEKIDDFGGLHLPNLTGSVQNNFKNINKRLKNLIDTRRVFDARDYGLKQSGSEDCYYVLQRLIVFVNSIGGGVIYIPKGSYRLSRRLIMMSNVGFIGAGKGLTKLLPFKYTSAFEFRGSKTNYIDNLLFSEFTIDGENQTLDPNSGYVPGIKGIFLQFYSNTVIDSMEILNIGATGIGTDMPINVYVTRNKVDNCGRLAAVGSLGASGIGLGTGAWDSEPIFVSQNLCTNNKNYGIFFEPQGSGNAQDAICAENVCLNNYAGIADCGIEGLLVKNNSLRNNVHGFLMYPGTNHDGKPGRRGRMEGNIIRGNTENGVSSICDKTDPLTGQYVFSNNHIYDNAKDGINFNYSVSTVKNVNNTIYDNEIYHNGRHGIYLEKGNVENMDIKDNRIYENGKSETGDAIKIDVPFTGSSIVNNAIRDLQTTKTQNYPVNISGNLTDVKITDNHCVGNINNSINLTGTQTNVFKRNNDGAIGE